MPSISSCPLCRRELTLPDSTDDQVSLVCPLCGGRFAAGDASAESRPLPPLALVAGQAEVDIVTVESVAASGGAVDAPSQGLAVAGQDAVDREYGGAQPAGSESGTSESPLELPLESSLDSPLESRQDSEERWQPGDAEYSLAGDHEISTGEGTVFPSEHDDYDAADLAVTSVPQKRSGAVGLAGQLLGMLGGGIVGLAIGYYVLLWLGGPRADFLNIRDSLPSWLVPHHHDDSTGTRSSAVSKSRAPGAGIAWHGDPNPTAKSRRGQSPNADVRGSPQELLTPRSQMASSIDKSVVEPNAQAVTRPQSQAGPTERIEPGPTDIRYSLDELDLALKEASAQVVCEHCQSSGYLVSAVTVSNGEAAPKQRKRCAFCGGKPLGKITPDVYRRLCNLAQTVTYVRIDANDENRPKRRAAVQELLLAAVRNSNSPQTIGRLAGYRLTQTDQQHGGILLAGTVQGTGAVGSYHRTRIVLLGIPKSVAVLSSRPPNPPLAVKDRVLIAGSIVDDPQRDLPGYAADSTPVVWGGLSVSLPTETRTRGDR